LGEDGQDPMENSERAGEIELCEILRYEEGLRGHFLLQVEAE
jgi:hypothetical protein